MIHEGRCGIPSFVTVVTNDITAKACASQGLASALERGYGRCAVSFFHQRGHAGPAVAALGANPASPLSLDPRPDCLVGGKDGAPPLPGTTKLSRCLGWQRSRASSPAHRRALCANGWATDTTALCCLTFRVFSQLARRCCALPMHLVTARYRIVLTPHSHQRGHVPLQVAPLCFRATSPLFTRWAAWVASQCARRCCTPHRRPQRFMVSASQDGSQSAVALGVGLGSLSHRGWLPVRPPSVIHSYGKVT